MTSEYLWLASLPVKVWEGDYRQKFPQEEPSRRFFLLRLSKLLLKNMNYGIHIIEGHVKLSFFSFFFSFCFFW